MRLKGVPLQAAPGGVHPDLMPLFCNAVRHDNVSVFLVFGDQHVMNALSVVTSYLGIPVLGYNTDRKVAALRVGLLCCLPDVAI